MPRVPKPCLNCGRLTTRISRCEPCQRHHDGLYDSEYRRLAAVVRATAVLCHICGEGERTDDPWQADHVVAGDRSSPLAAAHRSCNIRKGDRREWDGRDRR
jgi:hypothetical protein